MINQKHIKNLVIDIRGNIGGSTGNGEYLFSYLTSSPFRVSQAYEVKTLPLPYWDFSGVKDSEGKPILLKAADFTKTPAGTFSLNAYHALDIRQPKPANFKGNVYVLIDGWVGSQASSFASTVHHFKRGALIGEETGGNYNGNTGGTWANLTLPNSKIQLQMFVYKITRFTDKTRNSKGITPDYAVQPSLQDIIAGKDIELKMALDLIKAGK